MAITFDSIHLRGARVLIDRPEPSMSSEPTKTESGLYVVPVRRTNMWGLVATVTKVGPLVSDDIHAGTKVIIGEFSGIPIKDGESDSKFWIVGEGEIMAVLYD